MMKIDGDFLALQLQYSRWASERSLEAARPLDEEELTRDLHNSHGGVLGTLVHIYQADRIWLSRLQATPRTTLAEPGETWSLDRLAEAWTDVHSRYQEWARGTDSQATLHYKNLAGVDHSLPVWQVIFHLVNHASYHRGQITTMLRQLGYSPVATDLHVFYLEQRT